MCGLAGLLAWDPTADVTRPLERLSLELVHRGPDDCGIELCRGRSIGLVHRRLSIVDVAGGHQPMASEDGSVQVVFNGEIYNHADLRRQLEQSGHRFATRADTEVLVHGWEEWGTALFPRLNGIFSAAILDARASTAEPIVTLVRDPVGAKPLYLGRWTGGWWFSSELAAARRAGLAGTSLDRTALGEFLVYRFVPAPRTMFEGTWKVPAGKFVRLASDDRHDPAFHGYANGFEPARLPRSTAEWAEALRDGLVEAVRRQLMSDVPVGSLLSGGVDSTVVTSLMCGNDGPAPQCFAIGFDAEPDAGELGAARRAAAALGVSLREVVATDASYLAQWRSQLAGAGEPIANSGVTLVGLLCAEVARSHKVVLSGQGADELVGGYPRHVAERFYPWARHLGWLWRALPESAASSDRMQRMVRLTGAEDEAGRFADTLSVFTPTAAAAMVASGPAAALIQPVRDVLTDVPDGDGVNRLLAVDRRLSLADDLLLVADQMSMAHSVELRVPFLDLPLVSLIERMPSRLKVSRTGSRKWFYRDAVAPLLPASVRGQLLGIRARHGRKRGFATPMERWFRDWVVRDAERELLGAGSLMGDVLQGGQVRTLLREARDEQRPRARQLLSLFVLNSWMRGLEPSAPRAAARASA